HLHLDPQPALTRKAQPMTTMSPPAPPVGRAPATLSRPGGATTRRTPQAWLFLAPFALIYLAFMVAPMLYMFVAIFFNTSTVHPVPPPTRPRKAHTMTTMSPPAPPVGRAPATRSRPGGATTRRTPQAWLFLAPFAVIYLAFMVGPMIWMFVASFFNTSTVHSGLGSFAGLDNYMEMFGRDDFWSSLWHTLQFTLYTVPPLVVLSFVLAVLTNRTSRGQWFFRLAFFLPFILPSATISLIWVFIFTPTSGLWSLPATLVGMAPGAGILSSPNTA